MIGYRELSNQLKKGVSAGLYLFHGEEEYVRDRMLERLTQALSPAFMPEFNVNILHAPDADAVVSACLTPPMMADKKLVLVRDFPLLGGDEAQASEAQKKAGIKKLTDLFDRRADNVSLIFVHRGRVNANNRLKKLIAQKGAEVLFDPLKADEAQAWMVADMKRRGVELDRDAAQMLFYYAGPLMAPVAGELDKIELFIRPRTRATCGDVQRVTRDSSKVRIFDFCDNLALGRFDRAFEALEGLRRDAGDAFSILFMTARQYRLVLDYCLKRDGGASPAEIGRALGVPDFVRRNVEKQAERLGADGARQALEILLETESNVKSGVYRDADLALDAAVARIAAI